VRPKSVSTTSHVEHVVHAYLVPRFGDEIRIRRWLKSLHVDKGLAWPTIAKIRGALRRIYKIGIVHGHVAKNPLMHIETRSKSDYRAIVQSRPRRRLRSFIHALASSLHASAHLLGYSATRFRDAVNLRLPPSFVEPPFASAASQTKSPSRTVRFELRRMRNRNGGKTASLAISTTRFAIYLVSRPRIWSSGAQL
jgi:hypothetical protein